MCVFFVGVGAFFACGWRAIVWCWSRRVNEDSPYLRRTIVAVVAPVLIAAIALGGFRIHRASRPAKTARPAPSFASRKSKPRAVSRTRADNPVANDSGRENGCVVFLFLAWMLQTDFQANNEHTGLGECHGPIASALFLLTR